jgi:bacteriorhodopsin
MLPYELEYEQYSAVYNALSFVMASMGASTIYFFFHSQLVKPRFKTALCVSALVTLIAFYHYFRIFNSWVEAYEFKAADASSTQYILHATGTPFNDAYRYMDWLLTVPLLLIELVLVMDLDPATTYNRCCSLGVAAALMIVAGYPGEISMDHSKRWTFWTLGMIPFVYICWTLFVGLADAVQKQPENVRNAVSNMRYVTIISWLTYPFVYIIPMFGVTGNNALVGIQIGYSISDFISKCGLGLMVTNIALTNSRMNGHGSQGGLVDRDIQ